jgi:hypothetical protein
LFYCEVGDLPCPSGRNCGLGQCAQGGPGWPVPGRA